MVVDDEVVGVLDERPVHMRRPVHEEQRHAERRAPAHQEADEQREPDQQVTVADQERQNDLAVLRHKHLDVIPGRRQVGRADLPANPESITPGGDVRPPVPPHGLWSWIPGSARYARGPGMTAQFGL